MKSYQKKFRQLQYHVLNATEFIFFDFFKVLDCFMIINFLNLRQLNNPVMKKNLQYFSKEVIRRFSVIRISMVSLLIVGSALNALSSIQKVEITFDESDFSYSVDPATHHTYVECSKVNASYPRAGMPSLPLLSKNIVLRVGQEYVSTKVTVSKKAVKNRITLAKCSEHQPSNVIRCFTILSLHFNT